MIKISQAADINWVNLYRVAYQNEPLEIDQALLAAVDTGRDRFIELIERGVPCYGVTTGLGKLVNLELDQQARAEISANILLARAVAIGDPFPKPVVRAMMVIRLVNFLSAMDGVSAALCRFLVDRLNDNFTPWVPSLGHGMAADAIANSHAFQTLIGEGNVIAADGKKQSARDALLDRGVEPFQVSAKEGLALINGVCAAPALAVDAFYLMDKLLSLSNLVAAVSIEGLAASRDAIDMAVARVSSEAGVRKTIETLRRHLNHSQITAFKLQAPISYRVVPQVHGACFDALALLRAKIETCLVDFSDNPLMDGERFLSSGLFHNQHLVNQVEQVALALAHVGALSERRLHRLLSPDNTGLNEQLAARPGLDAGLVATHKASIDLCARLKLLAHPLSLLTSETSAGQEDYMSMAIPAILRLYDMVALVKIMLAYELLAGLIAVRMRKQKPGDGVAALVEFFEARIAEFDRDRSPGADVETILELFESDAFARLHR